MPAPFQKVGVRFGHHEEAKGGVCSMQQVAHRCCAGLGRPENPPGLGLPGPTTCGIRNIETTQLVICMERLLNSQVLISSE